MLAKVRAQALIKATQLTSKEVKEKAADCKRQRYEIPYQLGAIS